MKVLVIVVHPQLAEGSRMNKRLFEEVKKYDEITVRDLYACCPGDVIDIAAEQKLLEEHDKVVLQFPMWWYSSPYLLKKWTDEVLTYGWAYGPGGDRLHGKALGLAITTGGAGSAFQAGGYNHFTMSELTKPFQATANLIGMKFLPIFTVHSAMSCDDDELESSAAAYVKYVLEEIPM